MGQQDIDDALMTMDAGLVLSLTASAKLLSDGELVGIFAGIANRFVEKGASREDADRVCSELQESIRKIKMALDTFNKQ